MPHFKSYFDRDYLYAFDLQGKEVQVSIEKVTSGELVSAGGRKTKKPLCFFAGKQKPLALNSTNCRQIAKLYGNNTDDWVSKPIVIYPTITQMAGEDVECIRVKPYATLQSK